MSSSFKRRGRKAPPARPAAAAAAAVPSAATSSGDVSSSPSHPPRRAAASPSVLPGTRPWTSGLSLTSTGVREADSLLFSSGGDGGGGQPLQTSILLEEDRLADDLARALGRYWCAEGVAQGQLVLMCGFSRPADKALESLDAREGANCVECEGCSPEELRDFVLSLPRNLHLDKARDKAKQRSSESNAMNVGSNREAISAIVEEEEEEGDDGDGESSEQSNTDEGLVNAWQYRKSIQDARSGIHKGARAGGREGNGIYCHSYDLSRRMWDQFSSENGESDASDMSENPLETRTKIVDCSTALPASAASNDGALQYHQQGMSLFRCLWKHLQSAISDHPNTVIRLFLPRLPVGPGAVALSLLVSKMRRENLPVVILTTTRPWRWLSVPAAVCGVNKLDALTTLRNVADSTFSLDSFSSLRAPPPPEFSMLQGILTVRKCAPFTASHYTDSVTRKRPTAERFGIKRDGRKLTLQLLHLPPEEYSKGGSSTSGVRSGGGNVAGDSETKQMLGTSTAGGCSSLGAGGSLDF